MRQHTNIKRKVCQHILREVSFATLDTLLNSYNDLHKLTELSEEELDQFVGNTHTRALHLRASLQLAHLLSKPEKVHRHVIRMPRDVYHFCKEYIVIQSECQSILLSLNTKNVIIKQHIIDPDLQDDITTYKRFVFRHLILDNAASGILVHVLKEANFYPSTEQIAVANRLTEAGNLCGISLLDVIHLTDSEYMSFKDRGWI